MGGGRLGRAERNGLGGVWVKGRGEGRCCALGLLALHEGTISLLLCVSCAPGLSLSLLSPLDPCFRSVRQRVRNPTAWVAGVGVGRPTRTFCLL